jgi:hypothetical protein
MLPEMFSGAILCEERCYIYFSQLRRLAQFQVIRGSKKSQNHILNKK